MLGSGRQGVGSVLNRALVLCVGAIALTSAAPALAQGRLDLDPRNLAMGGAGVADTYGAFGYRLNPASFGFGESWDVQLPVAAIDVEWNGDLLDEIDRVAALLETGELARIQSRLDQGAATTQDLATVVDLFVHHLAPLGSAEQGLTANGTASVAFRRGRWGLSYGVGQIHGADVLADFEHGIPVLREMLSQALPDLVPGACGTDAFCAGYATALVAASEGTLSLAQAEQLVVIAGSDALRGDPTAQDVLLDVVAVGATAGGRLTDNLSALRYRDLRIEELAGTFGHSMANERFAAGVTVRYLRARTYGVDFGIDELTGRSQITELFGSAQDRRSTSDYGVDVGLLFRTRQRWQLGIVGKNLNSPTLAFPGDIGALEIEPTVRVGVSVRPIDRLRFNLDVEPFEHALPILPDVPSQSVHVGGEATIGRWIDVRFGALRNVAISGSEPTYTGGLGLSVGPLALSLSAAVSAADQRVDSDALGGGAIVFPRGAVVAFSLGWVGGGAREMTDW